MRAWARQYRRYLIAAPLVLAVGFGWNVWDSWHGNDGIAHRADDVPKGKQVRFGPNTVEFVGLKVGRPHKSSSGFDSSTVPRNAVVVVATFRARIDDVKGYLDKDGKPALYCESRIYNDEGWIWPDISGGVPDQYVPPNTPKNCDGTTLNKDFKDIVPKPHTWYRFAFGYYVPKDRAHGLRPTLESYKESPRFLRFSS
jgi:hypothetical protein